MMEEFQIIEVPPDKVEQATGSVLYREKYGWFFYRDIEERYVKTWPNGLGYLYCDLVVLEELQKYPDIKKVHYFSDKGILRITDLQNFHDSAIRIMGVSDNKKRKQKGVVLGKWEVMEKDYEAPRPPKMIFLDLIYEPTKK